MLNRSPEKQQQRELERQQKAVEKRAREFWNSPAGGARTAFDRGDLVYQFELDVRDASTYTIPMWKTGAMTTTTDASDVLNSIAREGWRLVTGSFVFQETGSESRDKFMASGQHIAVKGTVVGYYLFERNAELRATP